MLELLGSYCLVVFKNKKPGFIVTLIHVCEVWLLVKPASVEKL